MPYSDDGKDIELFFKEQLREEEDMQLRSKHSTKQYANVEHG